MNDDMVAGLIFKLHKNLTSYMASHFDGNFKVNSKSESEISERQYFILLSILYIEANTISKLSKTLCQSPSSLSTIVTKLAVNGYLEKKHFLSGEDGRTVVFELTEQGKATLDTLTKDMFSKINRFYESMIPQEREEFTDGFKSIMKSLSIIEQTDFLEMNVDTIAAEIFKCFIYCKRWADNHYENEFANKKKHEELLTSEQFRLLHFVKSSKISNISDLSRVLSLSESAVSLTVTRLNKQGFLIKEKCLVGGDGRKVQFYITPAGENKLEECQENILTVFKGYFNDLTPEARQPFYEGLTKLNNVFSSLNDRLK